MARNPGVDIQDVAGAPVGATNALPVRLTDGAAFYVASGGAGGGGAISTAAKGTTAAGSPTATDVDANRTALDVFVRGGGAGGGASTVADGADVAEGATTDVVWVSGGNGSLVAISKYQATKLEAIRALLAGSIAVTGTFWQATQPVSGPLTDTQLRASAVPVSMATQAPDVTDRAARLLGHVTVDSTVGLTDTQLRASNVPVVTRPVTSGGLQRFRLLATASTNANTAKASAGQVYGWYLFNGSAATKYVKLYNKASNPTVGTDVPFLTLPVPAGSAANVYFEDGIEFTTGIALAITGAVSDADATAVAANDVIVNLFYV